MNGGEVQKFGNSETLKKWQQQKVIELSRPFVKFKEPSRSLNL